MTDQQEFDDTAENAEPEPSEESRRLTVYRHDQLPETVSQSDIAADCEREHGKQW